METMLIKKLKLALMVVVAADIIGLIFEYPGIYSAFFPDPWVTYNVIELVSRIIH
jgi:hypothetical protein